MHAVAKYTFKVLHSTTGSRQHCLASLHGVTDAEAHELRMSPHCYGSKLAGHVDYPHNCIWFKVKEYLRAGSYNDYVTDLPCTFWVGHI